MAHVINNKNKNIAIINELLDSSSSESSEEETIINSIKKSHIPKIHDFVDTVVHNLSNKEFKRHFRINRDTFYALKEHFEESEYCPTDTTHGGSPKISAENHVLCFLWFAANKCCMRDVAQRFGIGQTSAFRQIDRVMNYLDSIAPTVIKFPKTAEEKEKTATEFQKVSNFPNVLGCIDGTSINVRTPAHKIKSTYCNRHDIPSITLQGICDFNRKFIDVFTGTPGKIHDARVYKLSFISKKMQENCGTKYHILGDGAYGIREWLLTPYRDYGTLTNSEIRYNRIFSATRVLIENTFGILKGRFRQLIRLDIHKVEKITKFIVACCVLHNICIDNKDDIEDDWYYVVPAVEEEENEALNDTEQNLRRRGEAKRMIIKYLL